MRTSDEPETLGELIADCAAIPATLLMSDAARTLPPPPRRAAREWTVDERCHAQVAGADEYV